MSTFDGKVAEFPDIRIDYFRPDPSGRPPLAFFLSHVHSDHLTGLESCKSPFIYCSPGTRDILLRLEKYPYRMNFAKGILETRKQTYRHLGKLLKAIPLESPTEIELAPRNQVRVTLFDANHCVGGVMFLIEGGGKAILYTGDIRSEVWWVNTLTRSPVLLPYVSFGDSTPMKKLDGIYLDTTFVVGGLEHPHKRFPSKADGLTELLQKVAQYPKDTLFYLDAWTFGYEDVWQTVSAFLGSPIHVDNYRYGLYRALATAVEPKAPEATKTIGFNCGNHFQEGCLTTGRSQIHSCEKGTSCSIWDKNFVHITPIISRHNGVELAELGAGGGQGDLNQQHELDMRDTAAVGQLMAFCTTKLQGQPQLLASVLQMLSSAITDQQQSIALDDFSLANDSQAAAGADCLDELPIEKLVPALAKVVTMMKQRKSQSKDGPVLESSKRADGLPKRITFPYSRHSSYDELCLLIEAFKPMNIYPCTVDEANWTLASSMSTLFGHLYASPPSFSHDLSMLKKKVIDLDVQISGSNPHSASSADSKSSEYTTPDTRNQASEGARQHKSACTSYDRDAENMAPTSTTRKATKDQNSTRGSREHSEERPSSRAARGDLWPPLAVDHYSPPRKTTERRIPTSAERPNTTTNESWPNLSHVEPPPLSPVKNRWQKRIAESTTLQWKSAGSERPKKQKLSRRSLGYGRLSPPPVYDEADDDLERRETHSAFDVVRMAPDSSFEKKDGALRSDLESRVAFRQQVSDALLGKSDLKWSDIGLVSGSGYQVREEEL